MTADPELVPVAQGDALARFNPLCMYGEDGSPYALMFAVPDGGYITIADHARIVAELRESVVYHMAGGVELQQQLERKTLECESAQDALRDAIADCTANHDRAEAAEARADAAMGLLRRWAMCGSPQNATLTQETDAFLAQQALAGGERKE